MWLSFVNWTPTLLALHTVPQLALGVLAGATIQHNEGPFAFIWIAALISGLIVVFDIRRFEGRIRGIAEEVALFLTSIAVGGILFSAMLGFYCAGMTLVLSVRGVQLRFLEGEIGGWGLLALALFITTVVSLPPGGAIGSLAWVSRWLRRPAS